MTGDLPSDLPSWEAGPPGQRGVVELLAEAVHIWLRNLWPLAAVVALVEVPIGLVSIVPNLPYGLQGPVGLFAEASSRPPGADNASTLLLLAVYLPAVVFLTAALEALAYGAIAEAWEGRRPRVGEAWRAAGAVLRPMVAKEFMLLLAVAAIAVPAVLLAMALGGLIEPAAGASSAVTVGGPVVVVVGAWLLMRAALSGPAIVGERLSGRDALRRSAMLTHGRLWRTAATIVVAGVPNFAVGLLAGGLGILPGFNGMLLETAGFLVLSPLLASLPMCASMALYYEARRAEAGAWSIGIDRGR